MRFMMIIMIRDKIMCDQISINLRIDKGKGLDESCLFFFICTKPKFDFLMQHKKVNRRYFIDSSWDVLNRMILMLCGEYNTRCHWLYTNATLLLLLYLQNGNYEKNREKKRKQRKLKFKSIEKVASTFFFHFHFHYTKSL